MEPAEQERRAQEFREKLLEFGRERDETAAAEDRSLPPVTHDVNEYLKVRKGRLSLRRRSRCI